MLKAMRLKKPGNVPILFDIMFIKLSDGAETPLTQCVLTSYDWRKRTITLLTPDRDSPRTIHTCTIVLFNQIEVML